MIEAKAKATRSGVPARVASELLVEAAKGSKLAPDDPQQSFRNFEAQYNELIEQYQNNSPPPNGPVGRSGRPQPPPPRDSKPMNGEPSRRIEEQSLSQMIAESFAAPFKAVYDWMNSVATMLAGAAKATEPVPEGVAVDMMMSATGVIREMLSDMTGPLAMNAVTVT